MAINSRSDGKPGPPKYKCSLLEQFTEAHLLSSQDRNSAGIVLCLNVQGFFTVETFQEIRSYFLCVQECFKSQHFNWEVPHLFLSLLEIILSIYKQRCTNCF